jgi:serine/threonine-protein kinase
MAETPNRERPIRVIGRYALYGRLAAGGMATVHFGRLLGPAGFSRTVAIKRLHPQFAKDPEFVAMFLDEARLAARIQHPNVVATVDVVAMSEELFLVMDYVRGESFSRLLRASRKRGVEVTNAVLASVIVGMLHGLHAAHEAKDEQGRPLSVVHRDVSPQNVLIGVDGVARVLDFGVAKAAARVQITRDGQMKGKLSYMAPEQLQGKGVDRRTDVFAAGIVFWEALTGRRLFDAAEPADVLNMITTDAIPPPSAVVPSVNRALDDIVMKALARAPDARFQTAREFAIAIEEASRLASAREVGEWVERVAGETLLHREQAVAEIEAVSSITDVGSLVGSAPLASAGFHESQDAVTDRDGSTWDEGPTHVVELVGGRAGDAVQDPARLVREDAAATRVQVPRPQPAEWSIPPRIPTLVPRSVPAAGLKSIAPPKPLSSRPPASRASSPRVSVPPLPPESAPSSAVPVLGLPFAAAVPEWADDEHTLVMGDIEELDDSVLELAPSLLAPSLELKVPRLSAPQVFDDDTETTTVYDPSTSQKPLSQTSTPVSQYAIPTNRRNTRPPTLSASERAAALRTAPPTVIVKDDTPPPVDERTSRWAAIRQWGWTDSPVPLVALAATVLGVLVGITVIRSANDGTAVGAMAPEETRAVGAPVVAHESSTGTLAPLAPIEPVPAPSTPPEAVAPAPPARPPVGTPREASRAPAALPAAIREAALAPSSSESAPEPDPAPVLSEEEELSNPYTNDFDEGASTPEPAKKPAVRPKPAVPATRGPRDCRKPYFLDADGIRRVKPECL